MAFTAGVTRATGDTILATDWNNYNGASGSIDYLNSTPGPLTYADFTTAVAPAAPGAGKGRYYTVTGDRPGYRSGLAGAAEVLESQANKNAASGYAGLDSSTLLTGTQVPNTHGASGVTTHHGQSHDHSAVGDGQTLVPVTIGNNGSIAVNGRLLFDKGVDVASAATLTPGTDGNYFHVTGITGITAIASLQAGTIVVFEFDGALTITHNAVSLILQGAANLTTAAGDVVAFVSEGAGNWRELFRRLAAASSSGPAGGELSGTYPNPSVAATHSGSAHHVNTQAGHNAWHGDVAPASHSALALSGHTHSYSPVIGLAFVIDGGGAAITTGQKGHLEIPFAMTITGWTLLGDQSGSVVIDVWKTSYAGFPPTVANTITGTEKPTLSVAQKNQNLTVATWTTAVAAGDTMAFNVDSATTVQRVVVVIRGTRTVN